LNALLILLFASLSVALIFLGAFIWSVKTGQLEDVSTPALRILHDEEPEKKVTTNLNQLN
jgi:cbb3-type cytochrome oxidase maturation protein